MSNSRTHQDAPKAAIFILHFGPLPGWFDLWKASALLNPSFRFTLFQDARPSSNEANVHLIHYKLEDFNRSEVLIENGISCNSPYKICDFRPILGEIFSEKIADVAYWGWGDLDVIYGSLSNTLGASLGNHDYIGTGRDGQSGPLALLRNCPEINTLWRESPVILEQLTNSQHFAIDEVAFLELLKSTASCDLKFRECLDDLPVIWRNGHLCSTKTGSECALHHFGGRLSATRPDAIDIAYGIQSINRIRIYRTGRMSGNNLPPLTRILRSFFEDIARPLLQWVRRLGS